MREYFKLTFFHLSHLIKSVLRKKSMQFTSSGISIYENKEVALLTQHAKEKVIVPVLNLALACRVKHVTGYDTDRLGTFTRDILRQDTQIEAARQKARIGMKLSGLSLGIASEGSFGADPFTGMLPWNVEMLTWIDDKHDIEIVAMSQGESNLAHILTNSWEEIELFAQQAGFPEHYLVVRPESENDTRILKGISDWDALKEAFVWAHNESQNNLIFVETDMRAHANPKRMQNIRLAAEELAKKISSTCPACNAPGYWIVEHLTGLPCQACGTATHEIRAEVYGCCKCMHRVTLERSGSTYANPGLCEYCNP
jgi:Domain of unknown function (DUF6671)